jgi:hypothetical protein
MQNAERLTLLPETESSRQVFSVQSYSTFAFRIYDLFRGSPEGKECRKFRFRRSAFRVLRFALSVLRFAFRVKRFALSVPR